MALGVATQGCFVEGAAVRFTDMGLGNQASGVGWQVAAGLSINLEPARLAVGTGITGAYPEPGNVNGLGFVGPTLRGDVAILPVGPMQLRLGGAYNPTTTRTFRTLAPHPDADRKGAVSAEYGPVV